MGYSKNSSTAGASLATASADATYRGAASVLPGFDLAPGFARDLQQQFSKVPASRLAPLLRGEASPALQTPLSRLGSEAAEDELAALVLAHLRAKGVTYADLRLGADVTRHLVLNDTNIARHSETYSSGIGIRVLVHGFWGFAATADLSAKGVRHAADQAFALASAVAAVSPRDSGLQSSQWAEEPAHVARFDTPVAICPFSLSTEELAEPLRASAAVALSQAGIKRVHTQLPIMGSRRLFASTDGAHIRKTHLILDATQRIHAVTAGTSGYRTLISPGLAGGFEHVLQHDFPSLAATAAADAVAKCHAKPPSPGRYDLILDGHNLALTMHESVGHPTELDRVLGYELGFAGGSFASLDKLGSFRYASPIVNFTANNRLLFGGASVGYDDEGVACQAFPIIEDGILVGYGTNRETAHRIGAKRANGTCRATSWRDTPIVRIPNLHLAPGKDKLSLEELVADTKQGILMLGRDSFSIDQMRYNFQFGADMSYRVEGGKITEPLRDVIYQSMSPEFWSACDAICDKRSWQMHGVANCGKGQPLQLGKMMHGAAPSRFRQIRVGY